jgi:hypothetical protein
MNPCAGRGDFGGPKQASRGQTGGFPLSPSRKGSRNKGEMALLKGETGTQSGTCGPILVTFLGLFPVLSAVFLGQVLGLPGRNLPQKTAESTRNRGQNRPPRPPVGPVSWCFRQSFGPCIGVIGPSQEASQEALLDPFLTPFWTPFWTPF